MFKVGDKVTARRGRTPSLFGWDREMDDIVINQYVLTLENVDGKIARSKKESFTACYIWDIEDLTLVKPDKGLAYQVKLQEDLC